MSQAALVQALTEGPVPLVKKRAMDAAILEQEVTGEKLSAILVRNGFIRHSELLKVILRVSPEILGEQSIHDIQVPYNILEKYGIVLVAESDAKLFVACLASQAAVRYVLKPYFPHAEIEFLPLNPAQLERMPTVKGWLRHAEVAKIVVEQNCGCADHNTLGILTEENVVAQLDHLRTHPSVAARLASGQLFIHGWIYNIGTSEIRAYDAEKGEFRMIGDGPLPMATPRARYQAS